MTQKEFKELADVHTYGKRGRGLYKVYFKKLLVGYKYEYSAFNTTKAEVIKEAKKFIEQYEEKGINGDPWALKIAKSDEVGFKIKIVWS